MSDNYLFAPQPTPFALILGEEKRYPARRIFCVGRNYADHAKEMGGEVDREAPWYFTKPASALILSPAALPYPPGTTNFHYEMELVVALDRPAFNVDANEALESVYGYACGLDMTRRDLQNAYREKQRPWDLGKAFENSAVLGPITPAATVGAIGQNRIRLSVNGAVKQDGRLSDMIWSVAEIISHLSQYYHLGAGDLIYTGTPAGVGPVVAGDRLRGEIEGLAPVEATIGPPVG